MKIEDMKGLVCVLVNLKPRKLAGFESNGMVVAASNADHTIVELIRPAEGEFVFFYLYFMVFKCVFLVLGLFFAENNFCI